MSDKNIIHISEQGPWGKPKNGGGGRKPNLGGGNGGQKDVDDLIEEISRKFKDVFGGGNGGGEDKKDGGNKILYFGFLVFFALWIVSGIYQLQPGEQGVVTRFGKFERLATSGLNYRLPYPFEGLDIVNSEEIRMETLGAANKGGSKFVLAGDEEMLMLTGDENIINLSFNVQWKVREAKDFVFNIPSPAQTVRSVVESAMRDVIGRTMINAVLTEGKSQVQEETRKLAQETLDNYKAGIEIRNVNLLDASFPGAVVDAARDVQAARADQERARNEAEAYKNDILPRARGQAERMKQEAEGYKQEVVAKAQGDAARFISVYDQYKQAQEVTKKRMYLETMEKILIGADKTIIDNKTGVVPYLPLSEIKPSAGDKKEGL
ncbi:MAG: FtsH protease activity modulator HflK [Pseudomonadota bacterium]